MYWKLLKNDFRKNPWSNLILLLFMSFSAAIAVSVTLMLVQLFTSISTMYETAKPPHFLQMHKGELVQEDIDRFNLDYNGMEHWQTVPMIDIYGDELSVIPGTDHSSGEQFTLTDCRLDISLVKQNEMYDILLDSKRNRVEIGPGEIGVPVILLEQYDISIGDQIILNSKKVRKTFQVTSYVYDGQMNSTLCSSTRFLISDVDFDELCGNVGEMEYLIEAWFEDSSQAAEYQTAYEQCDADLPKNGQAVTYTMIFLLSAMTDLMMAMVFFVTGILLMVIAMICLRYVVLAELENDMRQIGTMKAMGIPGKGIRGLYLGKIRILMFGGCIAGFVMAFLFISVLTDHMNRTFGEQKIGIESCGLALLVCAAVYGVILLFSRKIVGHIQKLSVTDLLVTEKGFGKRTEAKDSLRRTGRLPVNLQIGLKEVRRGYGIIFSLLLIVSFLMVVPGRTAQTMENEEFITYMGSPLCDLLLEVEQGENLEIRKSAADNLLQEEMDRGNVEKADMLKRVRLQAVGNDGEPVGIHIDTGENAGSGLKYLAGGKPAAETEIALSCLMAEELEKDEGDTVILSINGKQSGFTVCGIYQDVTSGGRTARTTCLFPDEPAEKYTYQVSLTKNGDTALCSEKWREQLGSGYSIENMEEFVQQTLGGVSSQVRQASYAVFIMGVCLTVLIVLLFLKLRIAREAGTLTVKRILGIPFPAICLQELYPVLIAGGLGTAAGVFLAENFGDELISAMFSVLGLGLKRIQFAAVPVWQYFEVPLVLTVVLTIITCGVCRQIRKMDVTEYINE